jgi:Polyketide synthesis cyclase
MADRILIVARLTPGRRDDVADRFAASDETELPHALGVARRDLYTYHDLYFHAVEFTGPSDDAMEAARARDDFRRLSRELEPFVSPFDPATWRSPKDAMATRFYSWTQATGVELP